MFALRVLAFAGLIAVVLSASATARFYSDGMKPDLPGCGAGPCRAAALSDQGPSRIEVWMRFMAMRPISAAADCGRGRLGGPILTGRYTMPVDRCFTAPATWR